MYQNYLQNIKYHGPIKKLDIDMEIDFMDLNEEMYNKNIIGFSATPIRKKEQNG